MSWIFYSETSSTNVQVSQEALAGKKKRAKSKELGSNVPEKFMIAYIWVPFFTHKISECKLHSHTSCAILVSTSVIHAKSYVPRVSDKLCKS